MKKQFTLVLVALAALCALTGCGDRKDTTTEHDSVVTAPETTSPDSSDDLENGMDDVGEDIHDAVDDAEDAITDSGVPFDQMLENGSVHDTDGVLTDGENARSYAR